MELDTVFIGQVAQFEGTHLVTIVCQSYGAELVAKSFGSDPKLNVDNWNTTTGDTGAKTATFNGATQTNYDARGVAILVDLGFPDAELARIDHDADPAS